MMTREETQMNRPEPARSAKRNVKMSASASPIRLRGSRKPWGTCPWRFKRWRDESGLTSSLPALSVLTHSASPISLAQRWWSEELLAQVLVSHVHLSEEGGSRQTPGRAEAGARLSPWFSTSCIVFLSRCPYPPRREVKGIRKWAQWFLNSCGVSQGCWIWKQQCFADLCRCYCVVFSALRGVLLILKLTVNTLGKRRVNVSHKLESSSFILIQKPLYASLDTLITEAPLDTFLMLYWLSNQTLFRDIDAFMNWR